MSANRAHPSGSRITSVSLRPARTLCCRTGLRSTSVPPKHAPANLVDSLGDDRSRSFERLYTRRPVHLRGTCSTVMIASGPRRSSKSWPTRSVTAQTCYPHLRRTSGLARRCLSSSGCHPEPSLSLLPHAGLTTCCGQRWAPYTSKRRHGPPHWSSSRKGWSGAPHGKLQAPQPSYRI